MPDGTDVYGARRARDRSLRAQRRCTVGGLKVVKSCSYEDTSYSLLLIILLDL